MNVDVPVESASAADLPAIERLLTAAALPIDGVRDGLDGFVVIRDGAELVALAGREHYDAAVLLRSVVVADHARGHGLGHRIVADCLARAARAGATDAYLLTTTAEPFFGRLGFTTIARDGIAEAVRESAEFTSLCPASATVMHRRLSALG